MGCAGGLLWGITPGVRHGLAILLTLACAPLLIGLSPKPAVAADRVHTHTVYDDDTDTYITKGRVEIDVPFAQVVQVAGAFTRYRDWALRGINRRPGGKTFITQLHDVLYHPGGAKGRGVFDVVYDVDLVWPFDSEGEVIRFAVTEVVRPPSGGVQRLAVRLGGDSLLIERFSLVLWAIDRGDGSTVRFESRTRFVGLVDTFFTLSVYRRNIEWRIGKVIRNLRAHVEAHPSPSPAPPLANGGTERR